MAFTPATTTTVGAGAGAKAMSEGQKVRERQKDALKRFQASILFPCSVLNVFLTVLKNRATTRS